MPATININESQMMTALRSALLSVLGSGVEVIQAQANQVAMPEPPFVIMTPIRSTELSKPSARYEGNKRITSRSSQWTVQLDFFARNAQSMAETVAVLMRSEAMCELTENSPITPLYAGEALQTSMISPERQWEQRWTLETHWQFNPEITTPQQSATQLVVEIAEVDTRYPAEE